MSASIAAAAAAALQSRRRHTMSSNSMMNSTYGGTNHHHHLFAATRPTTSRYETLKQRDWNTFDQYLKNHKPVPLTLSKCGSEHVLEFLRYLDRFGETKHDWSSLEAVVDRLCVAFEEKGGRPETNPFGAPDVKLYLRQVRDSQAKALPM